MRPTGPARRCDDWPRPEGAGDPHHGEPRVSDISRNAEGLAVSGHAQRSDMGMGRRSSALAPISDVSRHWQGRGNSDSKHTERAAPKADAIVRAREVQRPKVGPDHKRGRRGTRRSAARKQRTVGNPQNSRKQRWPPYEGPPGAT